MTPRFTVHELRPVRGARREEPARKATKPDKAGNSGQLGKAEETGGPSGPEPTRYGDWERKGICVDF